MRLFVYGTLMRGEHHHASLRGAQFLGEAQSLADYEMRLVDYYPALIAGGQTAARGELFEVDGDVLTELDELEDVPALYLRVTIPLAAGGDAYAYILPRDRAPAGELIASGDFRSLPRRRRMP